MKYGNPGIYAIYAAVIVYVIIRQFTPNQLRPRRLLVIPLLLSVYGLGQVARTPPDNALAFGLLAANAASAVVLGALRALSVRVWSDQGQALWQGTLTTFVLWLVAIAFKVGLAMATHQRSGYQDILFFVGLTFAVQNLIILARAQSVGARLDFARRPRQPDAGRL